MRKSTHNIFTRSLSGLLALLTIVGILASLSMLPVFAAEEEEEEQIRPFSELYEAYYLKPEFVPTEAEKEAGIENPDFSTEAKRIAAMTLQYTKGDFELYVDKITGEVAVKDITTGDILFTNPFNITEIPDNQIAAVTKRKLLSQVYIYYLDNDVVKHYNSFTDAALLEQIKVKKLSGGVRIEYSIGEEESRTLVPRQITQARFEEMIIGQLLANLPGGVENRLYIRTTAWYTLKDPEKVADQSKEQMYEAYPITRTTPIYVFDESAKAREIKLVEGYIKTYCPKYTFEELDKDHRETGYTNKDKAPANFKMALEYYLTDNGVQVRFPASGLRFDESLYQLSSIEVLQYMGAGINDYNGYTFIPDGSGTLIRFEDTFKTFDLSGKVYGQDYAYQEIGNANQEVYRMPVFGVVSTNTPQEGSLIPSNKIKKYDSGYVAIVTEGDALTNITSSHGGSNAKNKGEHFYNSVFCSFNPRPKDSYNLAEAISIGSNTKYTVVSERKYTGSFRINYIMLTDPDNTKDRRADRTYYEPTYVGMAKAYRDYLETSGKITKIEETKKDIPLFVEVFGLTETDETVLSIPVTVKKALTSFENLKAMVDELGTAKSPITNINFKLTGFINEGMVPTMPTKVKFEKVTGGNSGFLDFLDYAATHGIDVYPEFEFAYMTAVSLFDGFSYDRDAVKTIDNRYITKREYDAVLQTFTTTGKICISPCVYRDFFAKFNKSMTKLLDGKTTNVSLSSLGSDLNSDFDEDAPYNREDAKVFTEEMLKQFTVNESYGKILVDCGNAYAVPYASVVLNAPLDSSRFLNTSETVPFFGLVYHGYIVFAGSPTNMAGDIKYETLKILENGATLYMMLSYQNVELLKEDPRLSKYYAISYDIWKEHLLTQYDEAGNVVSEGLYDKLNNALADVQTSRIENHLFIDCTRKFTDSELESLKGDAKIAWMADMAVEQKLIDYWTARINDYNRICNQYTGEERDIYLQQYNIYDNSATLYVFMAPEEVAAIVEQGNLAVLEACRKIYQDRQDKIKLEEYEAKEAARIDRTITDGSVVYVEYENGHWFILNYNTFVVDVEINGQTISVEPMDFYDSKANA
ncbi:MAG: hypothetical protein E7634_00245 [Ruminococcaceae bacterium]|nr:hypothetical protein [Oscillospiraceae bacterium]